MVGSSVLVQVAEIWRAVCHNPPHVLYSSKLRCMAINDNKPITEFTDHCWMIFV